MLTKEMMEKGFDRNIMIFDSDAKSGELTARLILLMQSINIVNEYKPLTDLYVPPCFEYFAVINYIDEELVPGHHHMDIIDDKGVFLEESYKNDWKDIQRYGYPHQVYHALCGGMSLHLDSRLDIGGDLHYEDFVVTKGKMNSEKDKYLIVGTSKDRTSVQLGSL